MKSRNYDKVEKVFHKWIHKFLTNSIKYSKIVIPKMFDQSS